MLERMFNSWAGKRQAKEIRAFVENLRVMDGDELGMVVACATDCRNRIGDKGFNLLEPALCRAKDPMIAFQLSSELNALQRAGNSLQVAGLMVWVHTLRATDRLELRSHGRNMWRELSRGFPHVEDGAIGARLMTGMRLDTRGSDQFPSGLTPDPL